MARGKDLAVAAGNAGLREGGHSVVAGQRRAQQQDRNAGAGGLAEPHAEIEQWVELELLQQRAMAGLGRHMPGAAMIERIRSGEEIPLEEFTRGLDPISKDIVEYGGLFNYNKARLAGEVTPPPLETPSAEPRRPMTR